MELRKRKNIRLKNYDYGQNGAYFITLCVKGRHEMFWDNVGAAFGRLRSAAQPPFCNDVGARIARPPLSSEGQIVENAIRQISVRYPMVSVKKYVIMPNHIHMILMIHAEENGRAMRAPTISTVVKIK